MRNEETEGRKLSVLCLLLSAYCLLPSILIPPSSLILHPFPIVARNLDGHEIVRENCFRKNRARLSQQLFGFERIARRVARADVRDDKLADVCLTCNLGRLGRGRVHCLAR